MSNTSQNLLSYIRLLAGAGAWRDDPRDDAELLSRFVETRDEKAFATLLWRHGTLVWRTCTRVLGNGPETEDACQVVFLALARKAGKLRANTLSGWLYRVARQTALNANAKVKRRQKLEHQAQNVAQATVEEQVGHIELCKALDEELEDLPERLRMPLLLHYLEGKSQVEIGRILGCVQSVVHYRLERAEATLRKRLERRGLALDVGMMATLLSNSDGIPKVSSRLIESTARVAVAFRSGTLTGVSAEAAEKLLRSLALKGVTRTSWALVLAGVFSLCVLSTGLAIWKGVITWSDAVKENPVVTAAPAVISSTRNSQVKEVQQHRVDIYGDSLPEGAVARLGTTRLRNAEIVAPVTFMPDGKRMFTGSKDCLLIWEFPSGRRLHLFGKSTERGTVGGTFLTASVANAVSADGKLVAIGTLKGDIELWNPDVGKMISRLQGHTTDVRALSFLADSNVLASAADNTVRFWDTATGTEIRQRRINISPGEKAREHQSVFNVPIVSFAPDGQTMAVFISGKGKNNRAGLWNLRTGAYLGDLQGNKESIANVTDLAFSADSQTLATAGMDGQVALWDVATRQARLQLSVGHKGGCYTVRLSPNGKVVTAGNDDGKVWLWDAKTGQCLHTLDLSEKLYIVRLSLVFSPDSKALITRGQTLKVWDVASGERMPGPGGNERAVNAVAFSSDGKSLVSRDRPFRWNDSSSVLVWDIATCKPRCRLDCKPVEGLGSKPEEPGGSVIFGPPDNAFLACSDRGEKDENAIRFSDAGTGKRLRILEGARAVAFTSDGKAMAVSRKTTVELCDAATGKPLFTLCDEAAQSELEYTVMAFTPDGRKLAAAHQSGVTLWDTAAGVQLYSLAGTDVSALAFSPDNRTLFAADQKALRLWEVTTGQERLNIPLQDGILQSAYSPDGRLVAAASGEEGTIQLWDAYTGRPLHRFRDDARAIYSLTFAPDCRTLASGNGDTNVLIWDVAACSGKVDHPAAAPPEELRDSWSALAKADAGKAYRALEKLMAAADRSVVLLPEHLFQSATVTSQQMIARLLTDLDSDNFATRLRARTELKQLPAEVEPSLRQALQNKPSPELRRGVRELLETWKKNGMSPPLLQQLRTIEVLEHIDTVAARKVLQGLAESTRIDKVGDEARAALQRLSRKSR